MADEDLQFELELLNQLTDPVPETNLSTILLNTHDTSTNNNATNNNTFFIGQPSLFPQTPVNVSQNPIISNMVPALIPPPPISLPNTYPTTHDHNYNVSFPQFPQFPPVQDSVILTSPVGEEQHYPEPNWEAINAFLRGQVRPGEDVKRLYTCHVCKAKYANAQALGGHMGMHRRSKNNIRGDEGSSSKNGGASKKPRRR